MRFTLEHLNKYLTESSAFDLIPDKNRTGFNLMNKQDHIAHVDFIKNDDNLKAEFKEAQKDPALYTVSITNTINFALCKEYILSLNELGFTNVVWDDENKDTKKEIKTVEKSEEV